MVSAVAAVGVVVAADQVVPSGEVSHVEVLFQLPADHAAIFES